MNVDCHTSSTKSYSLYKFSGGPRAFPRYWSRALELLLRGLCTHPRGRTQRQTRLCRGEVHGLLLAWDVAGTLHGLQQERARLLHQHDHYWRDGEGQNQDAWGGETSRTGTTCRTQLAGFSIFSSSLSLSRSSHQHQLVWRRRDPCRWRRRNFGRTQREHDLCISGKFHKNLFQVISSSFIKLVSWRIHA